MTVLDASAVLAYLRREPGAAVVQEALTGGATISAVNLAEVCSSAEERGRDVEAVINRLTAMGLRIEPFDQGDAVAVGRLRHPTRPLGLSLADRACLALGLRMGDPVLATDRALAAADVGVEVVLIR